MLVLSLTVVLAVASIFWSVAGPQPGAMLGWSVADGGDINGDGYDDVLVGAPGFDNHQTDEGRAYLYLGGPGGIAVSPVWWGESNQDGANLGISVAGAGDVNGDGFDDLLAGASVYDDGQSNEGAAFLWLGAPAGPGRTGKPMNAAWTAQGNQPGAYLGYSVAGAGDVNGDGFDDVIVGAWGFDGAAPNGGRVLFYPGSPAGPSLQPAGWIDGDQGGMNLGFSVAGAGDVNGDGYDDVVVGAPGRDVTGALGFLLSDAGRVMLLPGGPGGLSTAPVWVLDGDQAGGELGCSVAGAGDVNGDGLGDLIVGERGRAGTQAREGRALVYLGRADTLAGLVEAWAGIPASGYALYGYSVAGAGDVNGDGYGDVLVGADGWSGGLLQQGRIYLYAGSPTGPGVLPIWTAEGMTDRAFLGRAVAGVGDIDHDGLADFAAGSDGDAGAGLDAGRALLFTGAR